MNRHPEISTLFTKSVSSEKLRIRIKTLVYPVLLIQVLLYSLSNPAFAEPLPLHKVTVTGTAIIKVIPDEMLWTANVIIHEATMAKAKEQHDASLAGALKFIKSIGGGVKDLQAGGLNFEKNIYPGDNSFLKIHPFTCSTQITFTLVDLEKYGSIADAMSKMDGVEVQSVKYASSKEAEIRRDALKRALLDGHDKANDLAVTAQCTIDTPLSIEELAGTNVNPEMYNAETRIGSGSSSGVEAGQIEFNAKVIVSYELSRRSDTK